MSRIEWHQQLQVPATLQSQLHDYRRRVWTIKLVEAFSRGFAATVSEGSDKLDLYLFTLSATAAFQQE